MTLPPAEIVLASLERGMLTSPPPGLPPDYLEGFLTRARPTLLKALAKRLEAHRALHGSGPTAWGGKRGLTTLAPGQVTVDKRVVVLNGLLEWVHGTVVELPNRTKGVRLDSGATRWFPALWPELAPPTKGVVPRDITVGPVEGEALGTLEPFELWKRIRTHVRQVVRLRRNPTGNVHRFQHQAVAMWRAFEPWLARFHTSPPRWLSWSRRELRILELWTKPEAQTDGSPERLELDWLLDLPDGYQERYLPGDTVRIVSFGDRWAPGLTFEESTVKAVRPNGVETGRRIRPFYLLAPVPGAAGLNTCLPPFDEPVKAAELVALLLQRDIETLAPVQLREWMERYAGAHIQLLGESTGRLRLEAVDSRYFSHNTLKLDFDQYFLDLPAQADAGIELDLWQRDDRFDDALPRLVQPVRFHPALVPLAAKALVAMAMEHALPLNPAVRRCYPTPDAPEGVLTSTGGRRGMPVIYSWLQKRDAGYLGTRVVTPDGSHGRIVWSSQRPPAAGGDSNPVEVFHVRLDSGREEDHDVIHYETARPRSVVPDVHVAGRYYASKHVWEQVSLQYYRLLDVRTGNSRKAKRELDEASSALQVWYPAWRSWRRENPSADVPGYEPQADARIEALLREQVSGSAPLEGSPPDGRPGTSMDSRNSSSSRD